MRYILKNKKVILWTGDEDSWLDWMNRNHPKIVVANDLLDNGIVVSTVFLGESGKMFETMVVGGPSNGRKVHASSLNLARQNHYLILDEMKQYCRECGGTNCNHIKGKD